MSLTCIPCMEHARVLKQVVDRSNPRSLLPALLLANKCDLMDRCKVTAETLAKLVEELHGGVSKDGSEQEGARHSPCTLTRSLQQKPFYSVKKLLHKNLELLISTLYFCL